MISTSHAIAHPAPTRPSSRRSGESRHRSSSKSECRIADRPGRRARIARRESWRPSPSRPSSKRTTARTLLQFDHRGHAARRRSANIGWSVSQIQSSADLDARAGLADDARAKIADDRQPPTALCRVPREPQADERLARQLRKAGRSGMAHRDKPDCLPRKSGVWKTGGCDTAPSSYRLGRLVRRWLWAPVP